MLCVKLRNAFGGRVPQNVTKRYEWGCLNFRNAFSQLKLSVEGGEGGERVKNSKFYRYVIYEHSFRSLYVPSQWSMNYIIFQDHKALNTRYILKGF